VSVFDELLAANAAYAATFNTGELPAPPAKGLAVLTCMDARILPLAVFGLEPGDAHIVRNAGGRVTDDALRSLLISSHILGVKEVAVVHHTECAMTKLTQQDLAERIGYQGMDFRVIREPQASLEEDVAILRASPWFPPTTEFRGYEYDVHTGKLRQAV
jgi:carbonic anhydrase